MPRRSFRGARSGSGVHNKEWTASCIAATDLDNAAGGSASFVIFTGDEAETILRLHGAVQVELDATAVDERVTIAVAIGVVSARAAAAGGASVPRAFSEGSYPWFWHGWMQVSSGQEAAINNQFLMDSLNVDSKAMRKIKEDEVVLLAFEICTSTDQGGHVTFTGGFRLLTGD